MKRAVVAGGCCVVVTFREHFRGQSEQRITAANPALSRSGRKRESAEFHGYRVDVDPINTVLHDITARSLDLSGCGGGLRRAQSCQCEADSVRCRGQKMAGSAGRVEDLEIEQRTFRFVAGQRFVDRRIECPVENALYQSSRRVVTAGGFTVVLRSTTKRHLPRVRVDAQSQFQQRLVRRSEFRRINSL